jgi:L-aspartate oxidase
MGRKAFILRSKEDLNQALSMIEEILDQLINCKEDSKEFYECFNIVTVAYLIIKAALNREKSLGSHIIIDSSWGGMKVV